MSLSARQRQFLRRENGWASGLIAVALNCGLLWFSHRTASEVTTGEIVDDLLAAAFLLPFITTLIATPLVRRAVRTGAVAGAPLETWPKLTRTGVFGRAVMFGVMVWLTLAVPIMAAGPLWDDGVAVAAFATVKLAFVFALATLVTPWIARVAMADERPP